MFKKQAGGGTKSVPNLQILQEGRMLSKEDSILFEVRKKRGECLLAFTRDRLC